MIEVLGPSTGDSGGRRFAPGPTRAPLILDPVALWSEFADAGLPDGRP